MSLQQLRENIPDFARDIRLNLESLLSEEGAPGLNLVQLWGTALAVAYSLKNETLTRAVIEEAGPHLTADVVEAAKSAATIMAMNNVYYRFLHLAEDKEFSRLPAKLRMNVIGKPGIPKVDFEIMSLAVSAISGCGMCINAHIAEVRKAGLNNEGIQSSIRVASVLNASHQALSI